MLPKIARIRKKKAHEAIYQHGQRVSGRFLRIIILANNLSFNRFGFVVGAKISKKAVMRNKIKRRLRALVAEKNSSWLQGYDFLFLAFPASQDQKSQALSQDLTVLLRRLKICP
ncbi:ribonuclease P protein component [Candidatus Falkowbacteria bacterium CG_4_10_14_0_2_um_filter_48_10]|uniref:Ribonuclease P protein component n=1 Tax=Candidatus Falkowbacteria bacterium CG23_combo_of_CG06-09_8_20_14_all_49_15 TaxID=1974572 RepID=A0A2G9ZKY5_9BACT|nr:MAG: ribonuclease P protein component [Candidatus Falkowbacteria bacterium CG23_combo_of_CG06-09_8_20_14_all_49_15]PJA09006.1 MAG: ribonuclease P protein component [Candidatus Falkowbacteria bacterium CG_4_10_14_0_2_um_filter_48_10]